MQERFHSRRSAVLGFEGMVATSQPLAAQAGLRILLEGGNAADAAVAAAAALNVVEPMSTGMGGDMFALVYSASDRQVYALNGSGRAPERATLEEFQRRGLEEIPIRGILPVTVPGAAAGWADLVSRFGRLGLDRVLQPAIEYAERGFPVSELIAGSWRASEPLLRQNEAAAHTYLLGGRAPRTGQRFISPDLARSLRMLADQGPGAFYRGPIAKAIVATSQAYGGLFSEKDLEVHESTWVKPIHIDYRGYTVYECPPNGQGIAALVALNILRGYDLGAMDVASVKCVHLKMEAIKLGMADAARYVADPEKAQVPVDELLSDAFAAQRRALVREDHAIQQVSPGVLPANPDTVYLTVADGEGNAVSFINSLYMGFGSGLVVEGTGIALQNRGNLFSLDPEHPNCVAPGKRPYHTIIPCLVTRNDDLVLSFGVMGGFMQPQGHVQVLSNIVDHGMDPQQALDAPRARYERANEFAIEEDFPEPVYSGLATRGHRLTRSAPDGGFGGGQVIMVDPDSGALVGGSDPRKDGGVVAF